MSSSSENVDANNLVRLLRESASHVERGEFDSVLELTLRELQAYIGKHNKTNNIKTTLGSGVGSLGSTIGKKLGKISLNPKKEKSAQENAQQSSEMFNDSSKTQDENWSSWWSGNQDDSKPAPAKPGKPPFQRPNNPKFPMIANGWVEQQRRSKMRVVWKGVLISLVKGRNPKEETTLWIQREINNASTGKRELEALHQVPIKWLEDVAYLDFYGDNRWSIKVYNVAEEFYFRCADEDSAQQWVLTLRSVKDQVTGNTSRHSTSPANNPSINSTIESSTEETLPKKTNPDVASNSDTQSIPEQTKPRQTIKELRALAHGAGINTQGMERSDLERVVAKLQKPVSNQKNNGEDERLANEAARLREEQEAQRKREEAEIEEQKKRQQEEEEKRRKIEFEQRQRVAEARRKAEEERKFLEEQRRAAILAEEQRRQLEEQRRQAAEEHRRRLAEQHAAEQRRRQEEERRRQEEAAKLAQQRYQQQQQQWQQQQWQQQQAAQQQAAAAQRAQAAQQAQWNHWRQQQQQQQHAQQQQAQQHAQQQQYAQQQQQQQQQRQAQQPYTANGNSQPQQQPEASNADLKYTKMAEESDQGGEEKVTAIKRNILLHWALQPPQLQHLRPITDLISNIHSVFPPAFGVSGHEYFSKWNAISRDELVPVGTAIPDEEKLKKAVRKLRFFLHPDKLPRDLDEEQSFMCKMLWDISSDAWEEFKKRDEELDWIQK